MRHPPDPKTRASFSLSESEIKALDIVVRGLVNGKDLKQVVKTLSPELGGLLRKAQTARATIERKKNSPAPSAALAGSHTSSAAGAGETST